MSTQAAAVTIGIVEDHPRYLEALRATIDAMDQVQVMWIADRGEHAVAEMAERSVDLAIVDLSLPGETGDVLIRRLRERWPSTAYVVVSGHTESQFVRRSFEAGAIAYVVKGRPSELRDGIRAASAHELYMSPQLRTQNR